MKMRKMAVLGLSLSIAACSSRNPSTTDKTMFLPEFDPRQPSKSYTDPLLDKVYKDVYAELGGVNQLFGYLRDINRNGVYDVAIIVDRDPDAFSYHVKKHPAYSIVILEYRRDSRLGKVFESPLPSRPDSMKINPGNGGDKVVVEGKDFVLAFEPDGKSYRNVN